MGKGTARQGFVARSSTAAVFAAVLTLAGLSGAVPAGGVAAAVQPDAEPPVVLVHGLRSTASVWADYVGPDGFLAGVGRVGFAVGDGQAPGTMDLGDPDDDFARTGTIADNAEVLRDYIAAVKEQTGSSRVDLVAHSMGGLISRYYIDRLMAERDVNRLIMLGTPNAGSDCAVLPARLGISTPATVELRPSYLTEMFNRQVSQVREVPFHTIAGTAYLRQVQSPCAAVPSDLLVSLTSVEAVGGTAEQVPLGHSDLVHSEPVFTDHVAPLLADPAAVASEPPIAISPPPLQFVTLASGQVPAGGSAEEIIALDEVAVASFAVYDPSQSLVVSVRGASGDLITLDPDQHGLVEVDDPETMLHLGYGFENPNPGPWRVTLHATAETPDAGADYAVTAHVVGGPTLTAHTSELLPEPGEEVRIRARLESDGNPVQVRDAYAWIVGPDGSEQTVPLSSPESTESTEPPGEWTGSWLPQRDGIYSVDVVVSGESRGGTTVERVSFLAVEVESDHGFPWWPILLGAAAALSVVTGGLVTVLILRRRRRVG